MAQPVHFSEMEAKIMEALPCMAHELEAALAAGKKAPVLSLQIPTNPPALPYFVCDLPVSAFKAVVSLCEAGHISFVTVKAMEAKLSLLGAKPRFPLVSLDSKPGQQYMLPLRVVPGTVPGDVGGGTAGRFYDMGSSGTAFRCGGRAGQRPRAATQRHLTSPQRAPFLCRWNEPSKGKPAVAGKGKAAAKKTGKGKVAAKKPAKKVKAAVKKTAVKKAAVKKTAVKKTAVKKTVKAKAKKV